MSETDERAKIKNLCLRFLTQREHSAWELLWKLRGRGFADHLARQVVAELQTAGWQDERRFVESLIQARRARGMGPVRIRFELRAKGIDDSLIAQVLDALAIDWQQAAREVYRSKYGNRPIQTPSEYGRRYRFMAQRGFETEHIRTLLGEA